MEEYRNMRKSMKGKGKGKYEQEIIRREKGRLIHGKGLLIDNTWAMFTSHNFNQNGVKAGTTEIALLTRVQENYRMSLQSNLTGECCIID
jgi:hypothetical protein